MLILTRALNLNATFTANFSDVLPTSYYYEAIGVCRQLSIAQGDGDLFRPEDPISRQDLVTLTYRALMNAGRISESETGQDLSGFSDFEAISPYAKTPWRFCVKKALSPAATDKLPLTTRQPAPKPR